ncbi:MULTISPECIES: helix-turn-helix domain-containing protein [unclassified Polaribacter]|uniref:helix-turn-helix domain-containing protein n=1 Tax=unclassified Polaribacter TaxID=196858 RepID=UPI0011BD8CBA|nr:MULTISPECIES: helix-turn-helix domain-containing protein [unclassified Polaribacter]TXD48494.1 AraC family transcriptional regulator [Polaribacter sp. IC063]TXD59697.1 AraC family transcriptional regulator [Polaribacter sp. IC066]
MEFNYLENQKDKNHHLIDHFYQLKITKEDLPFKSVILSVGLISITCVFGEQQYALQNSIKTPLKDLTVAGQTLGGYQYLINASGYSIAFCLKPSALYKIMKINVSTITNKHVSLKELNIDLYNQLNPLFLTYKDDISALIPLIYEVFDAIPCIQDKSLIHIDKAVDLIIEKEGLIKVNELLKIVPFSQKSLENKFKIAIGLTPGKYIRQYRFMKMMRKYESKQMDFKDLMYLYNYYDLSHFLKDFKLFMGQTPNSYFKKEYPLLKKYLKE